MPNRKQNLCPRCFIGVDDDGDGNCSICAQWTDARAGRVRMDQAANMERAVQTARDEAFNEIIFQLGIVNDAIGTRVVEVYRRQYPKHGQFLEERRARVHQIMGRDIFGPPKKVYP